MTKREKERIEKLLPGGIPRWVRCYDNGGPDDSKRAIYETIDRYTVVFTGKYRTRGVGRGSGPRLLGDFMYVAMSGVPNHPQGFCQHGESKDLIDAPNGKWPPALGRKNHLGKRIKFKDLPVACQNVVLSDYRELWGIPLTTEELKDAILSE